MTAIHEALTAFRADHEDILYEADRIARARAHVFGRRHIEHALQEARDFVSGPLMRHLYEEQQSLLAVMHEHIYDQHADVIDRDERLRARLQDDLARIQRAMETGRDVRGSLKEMEMCLRDYVQYEDNVMIPWVNENLGDILLREVDGRLKEIKAPSAEVTMSMKKELDALLA